MGICIQIIIHFTWLILDVVTNCSHWLTGPLLWSSHINGYTCATCPSTPASFISPSEMALIKYGLESGNEICLLHRLMDMTNCFIWTRVYIWYASIFMPLGINICRYPAHSGHSLFNPPPWTDEEQFLAQYSAPHWTYYIRRMINEISASSSMLLWRWIST